MVAGCVLTLVAGGVLPGVCCRVCVDIWLPGVCFAGCVLTVGFRVCVQVKNCEKLQNLLNLARAGRVEGTFDPADLSPPSCLLVEVPKDEVSGEEDFVCDYHDTVICSHIYPKPVIQLPV
ncbi:hypothetical protein ACOMHN_030617 [Nucella lapillus]